MTAREVVDSLASFAAGWVAVGGPLVLIGPFAGSALMLYLGTAFVVSGFMVWASTRIVATREGWLR